MKRKNFSVQAEKYNGIPNSHSLLKEFAIGKKAIVTSSVGGHNYGEVGTTFIISAFNIPVGSKTNYTSANALKRGGNNIPFSSFSLILEKTPKEIEDKIKDLEKEKKSIVKKFDEQVKECKSKLRFLKENKLEIFDEDEFKSFQALELLENGDLTIMEKSKILAQLIKN
jgi:hypothetical protein